MFALESQLLTAGFGIDMVLNSVFTEVFKERLVSVSQSAVALLLHTY